MTSRRQRALAAKMDPATAVEHKISTSVVNVESAFYFAARLSLAYVALSPVSDVGPITQIVAVAGLFAPALLKNRWYFVGLSALLWISFLIGAIWAFDNHVWLQNYWFFALALTRFAVNRERALALSARLLIGSAFLFAVVWKITSSEFRTGAFFNFASVTEIRMTRLFEWLHFIPQGAYRSNQNSLAGWATSLQEPLGFTLNTDSTLQWFWPVLAFFTIFVEATIAITFLAPLSHRFSRVRDVSLLGFALATYLLLPVAGFGAMLMCIGFASSDLPVNRRMRWYGGVFVFILIMNYRDLLLGIT